MNRQLQLHFEEDLETTSVKCAGNGAAPGQGLKAQSCNNEGRQS